VKWVQWDKTRSTELRELLTKYAYKVTGMTSSSYSSLDCRFRTSLLVYDYLFGMHPQWPPTTKSRKLSYTAPLSCLYCHWYGWCTCRSDYINYLCSIITITLTFHFPRPPNSTARHPPNLHPHPLSPPRWNPSHLFCKTCQTMNMLQPATAVTVYIICQKFQHGY